MMGKTVKKRGDAGCIGKHRIPLFERKIGCQNNGAIGFIARVDYVVKKICRMVVIGKVT